MEIPPPWHIKDPGGATWQTWDDFRYLVRALEQGNSNAATGSQDTSNEDSEGTSFYTKFTQTLTSSAGALLSVSAAVGEAQVEAVVAGGSVVASTFYGGELFTSGALAGMYNVITGDIADAPVPARASPLEGPGSESNRGYVDDSGRFHTHFGTGFPNPLEIKQYSEEGLLRLHGELKRSVKSRIGNTIIHGSTPTHGERQAAEQALMRFVEKLLGYTPSP